MKEKIWLTSDTHFNHNNKEIWLPRGFESVEEMNDKIIENWNSVVGREDIVYHLGDVALGPKESTCEHISRLNGKLILITGNHDPQDRVELYKELENVSHAGMYATLLKVGKYSFYLSHYPTFTANNEKKKKLSEHIINLYGHTHQKDLFFNGNPYMYNVGQDAHSCFPILLEKVLEDIREELKSETGNDK